MTSCMNFFYPIKHQVKTFFPQELTYLLRLDHILEENFYANLWLLIIFLICTWLESQDAFSVCAEEKPVLSRGCNL